MLVDAFLTSGKIPGDFGPFNYLLKQKNNESKKNQEIQAWQAVASKIGA